MKHLKKMIAPIIITAIIVLYFGSIALGFIKLPGFVPGYIKLCFIAVPLAICGIMIGVLISRFREIKGGEEDDLSKY